MLTGTQETRFLIVTVADREYSLPVSDVFGVLTLKRDAIFPLPFSTDCGIAGIFNYKGSVTGLLIPEGFGSLSDRSDGENLTAVLLRHGEIMFAVPVDQAQAVREEPGEGVTAVDAAMLYGKNGHADNQ